MFDQHSNAPAYLEKVSLGCLEINYLISNIQNIGINHLFLLHLYHLILLFV